MPRNSPSTSPRNPTWRRPRNQASLERSFSFSRQLSSNRNSFVPDTAIIVESKDHEASKSSFMMPFQSGKTTPDIRRKIEMASPSTAKSIAMNMYEAMKKHGLRDEISRTLARDQEVKNKGIMEDESDDAREKSMELLGMEYLMRDGIVTYLRNAAQVTPPIPQQVIRFHGVQYSRKFEVPSNKYETFGNKLVGNFTGPFRKLLQKEDSVWQDILKGIDGYIMPGSLTLLLGPPGCGKSTLLKVLAGRTETKNALLEGVVKYNDKYASEANLSRIIAYISGQHNKHIPFLTVKETLEFARDCSQTLRPENFTPQMRKFFAQALVEGQDPFLEYILEILDLKSIEDKLAGEAISDIDRQKLTIAELALGTYPVMLYDQPLSGSDIAVTYHLVNTIRTVSRIQQSSAVMSLTQISQEIFDLFDRIILLGSGQVIFQGPRQDVIPYFYKLGYTKPTYVESAEFLEDIVAGFGSQYMAPEATNLSIGKLRKCFRASYHYKDIIRIVTGDQVKHTYWVESEPGLGLSIKTPSSYNTSGIAKQRKETELEITKISTKVSHSGSMESTGKVQVGDVVTAISIKGEESMYLALGPQSAMHEHVSHAYSTLKKAEGQIRIQVERYEKEEGNLHKWKEAQMPFSQTWWRSTKTLVNRQMKITKRLRVLLILRILQATVLGLFTGTLFYQLGGQYDPKKMNSIRALGFVSTMSIMLINLVQLPLYMLQRPIFYKHKAQTFFRTSSYVVAHAIVSIPQTLVEATVYTLCVFFLVGMTGSVAGFFEYLFLLFSVAYFGSSVFFFLSAISSIPEVGNALAGILVSILLLFSGFVIYPSKIPTYWKWFTYINPIRWANVAYCRFQFQNYSDQCSKYQGHLPFCDQFPSMTVGKAYLVFNELYEDSFRPFLSYVIVVGWTALVIMMVLLGLKTLEFPAINQSLPHLRSSPAMRTFSQDRGGDSLSVGSQEGNVNELSANTGDSEETAVREENHASTPPRIRGKGGLDRWMEDFRIDLGRCGLGLAVEPVSLVFEDLSFNMINEEMKENLAIFSHITGYCNPGNMLAILGGSQETKSTLLRCLAGKIPISSDFCGNIQANGMKPGDTFFQVIGYAEKLDAHQPFLSVRESLQFSAALRLNKGIDTRNHRIHVELILAKLGLLSYANQLVGSLRDATGKTFEIAKKMTIAVELAANPSILFLEEPIYGLDSIGISNILNVLSQLSASGMNIIATLTHPNVRSLAFFDHTLILTKAGEQAYFGPTGANCRNLLSYFSLLPCSPKHLIGENPISFVMEFLGQGIKSRGMLTINFAETYKASSLHEQICKEIGTIKNLHNGREQKDLTFLYPAPFTRQAALVILRTQRLFWRNVQYTYGRLSACMIIGFLMGSLYFQIEYKDVFGVTSRSLYIYMQVILIGVISANNVIPQIGTDRLVYLRERRAGMYLPVFYPISWVVGEIPYFFFASLALTGIGNGLAGIATRSLMEFLHYWFVLFVFTLCLTYFGMMVTFLAPFPVFAAFFVSIVTSLWVSASGVVVVLPDIKFYRWMYWSNPFQYALSALTSISFYCNTKDCESNCNCQRLPDGSYVWDQLAKARALSNSGTDFDILILAAMCILFVSLAFLFFTMLKHNKRT